MLEGTVQTFWSDAIDGDEHFSSLEPGEFGELNLLNQRETLIAARTLEESSVLRLPRERFREFLIADPDIGEPVVRTTGQRRRQETYSQIGVLRAAQDLGAATRDSLVAIWSLLTPESE